MTELQEARLLGRAIRKRWDIPDNEKANVMDSLLNLAVNGIEESTKIAAARAIIAAEGQNQADEHKFAELQVEQRNAELDAIASDLGLDKGFIEAVARETGTGDSCIEGAELAPERA